MSQFGVDERGERLVFHASTFILSTRLVGNG